METQGVNYLAVAAAAVAYMILGAIWYSPMLFGTAWMRGIGKTKEQIAADFTPANYFWAFVSSLLASYGIARLMAMTGGNSIADGIKLGLVAGVCFVLAALWVNDVFEARKKGLTIINVMYHLVGLLIAGMIIGVWR